MAWKNIYKSLVLDQETAEGITLQFAEYFGIWNYEQTNDHVITWYTKARISQHESRIYKHIYNAITDSETVTEMHKVTAKAKQYMNH